MRLQSASAAHDRSLVSTRAGISLANKKQVKSCFARNLEARAADGRPFQGRKLRRTGHLDHGQGDMQKITKLCHGCVVGSASIGCCGKEVALQRIAKR